jgi:hypothetical protein
MVRIQTIKIYIFVLLLLVFFIHISGNNYSLYYPVNDSLKIGVSGVPYATYNSDKGTSMGFSLIFFEKNLHKKIKSGYDFRLRLDAENAPQKETSFSIDGKVPIIKNKSLVNFLLRHKNNYNNFYGIGGNTKDLVINEFRKNEFIFNIEYLHSIDKSYSLGFASELGSYKNYDYTKIENIKGFNDYYSVFGLGMLFLYQTKEPNIFPSSGELYKFKILFFNKDFLSDHNFIVLKQEFQKFWSYYNNIFGYQIVSENTFGSPPFHYFPAQGSSSLMRGVKTNRYIEKQFLGSQVEYRSPYILWRISSVIFISSAISYNSLNDLKKEYIHISEGFGFRFALDKEERLNLRTDVGFYQNKYQLYLKFSEAF